MIRRLGERVQPNTRYRLRPGVYGVLRRGPSVLLTHQDSPDFEYQLPGGGLDPGEQPLAAFHREVFEETGWIVARPRRLGAFRRFVYLPDYGYWAEKLCTIYLAAPIRRLGPPTEPGHNALWMPLPDAVQILGNEGDQYFTDLVETRGLHP